jgi:hypothetical protein
LILGCGTGKNHKYVSYLIKVERLDFFVSREFFISRVDFESARVDAYFLHLFAFLIMAEEEKGAVI